MGKVSNIDKVFDRWIKKYLSSWLGDEKKYLQDVWDFEIKMTTEKLAEDYLIYQDTMLN